MPDRLTKSEAREVARMAADEAVKETFRALGFDLSDVRDLNGLREDLRYSRRLRQLTETSTSKIWLVVLGMLTVGTALFIWNAIKSAVSGLS